MYILVQQLNFLLALGTVALQIIVVLLIAAVVIERRSGAPSAFLQLVRSYGLLAVFIASLAGMAMSLFYSEYLGFVPCGLCWLQRVFLYPIVFLSGLALWKRDKGIAPYLMLLSAVGAVVALYHHYLQMGGSAFVSCPVVDAGADCAKRIIFEFGYITFPLMSLTFFVFIFTVMLILRKAKSVY